MTDEEASFFSWYMERRSTHHMISVDINFICDEFNRTGIDELLQMPSRKLNAFIDYMCLGVKIPGVDIIVMNKTTAEVYNHLHARYIVTDTGLVEMRDMYENGVFGECPRDGCNGQHVLPLQLSQMDLVQVYCPKCDEAYRPDDSKLAALSGTIFGYHFPQMFFMHYPELRPVKSTHKFKVKK